MKFIAYTNFHHMPSKAAQRAVIRACREADLPEPTFLAGPENHPRAWAELPDYATQDTMLDTNHAIYSIYEKHLTKWMA